MLDEFGFIDLEAQGRTIPSSISTARQRTRFEPERQWKQQPIASYDQLPSETLEPEAVLRRFGP